MRIFRWMIFVVCATFLPLAAVFAADADAVTSSWYAILAGDGFWGTLVVGLAGLLYKWLRPVVAAYIKDSKWKRFLIILESGVGGLKVLYTDKFKEANADGKLTVNEAQRIRGMCRNYVIEFAAREGIDVVREYGNAALDMLIEWMLGKIKANALESLVSLPLESEGNSDRPPTA